ncbi:MAG TPA: winged helix-turn-helix domain-containing protein [Blastocatellia bacterium]|nr:winged helix-turn-helix domain-containing protein [Blastocatellia bacterium]
MSQVRTSASGFRFDDFYLDAGNRQLSRDGEPVALNSKYFDVLLLLVSRSGRLVEKQSIFEEVWQGVFVTDAALTQCIKDIRKQLGDDASAPRYIKTVPKHGYIFIADVVEANGHTAGGPDVDTAGSESPRANAGASRSATRPYKFLDYYTEQDAGIFFGREPEIETICSQIIAHQSFILHGRSGVGKSSIVRAGLMPRLKSEGHLAFVVRSFTDPLHHMENALAQVCGAGALKAGSTLGDMVDHLASLDASRCIVFFFDQFEEFFSLLAENDRAQFLNAARLLTSADESPVRMVFALREDMLAEMSQLKTAIPEIFHHEYRLKRLSREQASRAITEPARAVGCRYDQQLVELLLDDLGDEDGVDPPQLQIVCDNLFDSRDSAGALTVEAYELLGTASRILAGYLERVLNRFNPQTLRAAKEVLKAMISTEGRRLVLKSSQLDMPIEGQATETRLIEELIAARVVRRRSQDGEAWLELAHDFLTAEVARWLTAEEIALKRARAVIERAMQNFKAHKLMIDADALDLLLPFGEQLDLSVEEADFLLTSILNRSRSGPAWLVKTAPDSAALIGEASKNADPEVRLRAVEAAATLKSDEAKELLSTLALWDENLLVRKAASIALAEGFGAAAQQLLSENKRGDVGPVRRAISLAMIRDYDKRLVRLSIMEPLVALLVVGGLMWVRLRRDGAEIVRQGMGGAIGGAASGLAGGLLLGGGLATARHASAVETWELLFVLISLGGVIGAVGGLCVSFGMIAAAHVTYRHSRWWAALGGAAGGALIGGSTKLLGVDTIKALFGQSPAGITGAFEGAVIGLGVSAGTTLVAGLFKRAHPWQRIVCASLGATCAGVLLTVIGGNLFSASLEIVARMFANSQMRMDPLASFFGEGHFGQTTQIVLGGLEGLLFGVGVSSGIEIAGRDDGPSIHSRELALD